MRQRCLLIINQIFQKCKILDLETSLLNKLKECYMERSRDKVIAVRSAAASGLCRLQNSIDPDEEVLSYIAVNIRCERNSSIRQLYASSIMLHAITMTSIIETLRDEELFIRVAMLKNLEEHSLLQQMSVELRRAVIHCLEDRNSVIVQAAESVIIKNWASKNSLLLILSLIEIESDELAVMLVSRLQLGRVAIECGVSARANYENKQIHLSNDPFFKPIDLSHFVLSL